MGAMPEEIEGASRLLSDSHEIKTGNRTYYSGYLNGISTVVVFSRWGKVAAAATVATLIHKFGITDLIFTGVAGGIHHELNIGDIVIGNKLVQHDLDARPLIKQYEIPLLGLTHTEADPEWLIRAEYAVSSLFNSKGLHHVISAPDIDAFSLHNPKWKTGTIASGDQFFYLSDQKKQLQTELPETLCVEMEGAAVAQVCHESGIPFVVIRTISDDADEHSPDNFPRFIKKIASTYSTEIIKNIYSQL